MKDWLVLFRPDGEVVATAGGAPSELEGTDLRQTAVPSIRRAADDLLEAWRASSPASSKHARVLLEDGGRADLCVVEAVRLHREAVDVANFIGSTLAPLEPQAEASDVRLRVVLPETPIPLVYLDAEKIGWVLTTLVGNALRYARSGGWLMPGSTIRVTGRYDDKAGELHLGVEDEGPGIPEERLARLFVRATGPTSSAGLALRIAHDFVAAHGGVMSVASSTREDDHGTKFHLRIPNTGRKGPSF